MTMDRSLIDPEQQVAAWDTIMAAQAPSYDPIQYTSSVESVPANVDIPQQEYVPDAADTYSYASPAPEYQPTYTPGPSLADVTAQEYEQYSAPDFSYQPEPAGFFESLNPQFAESNAQFDYTTNPANRADLDPIGAGLRAASDAYNTGIPVYSDIARDYLIPGVTGAANAQNPLTWFDNPLRGISEGASRLGATAVVPVTLGDVALTAIPAALALPEGGAAGALAEAFGTGLGRPYRGIENLPDAARFKGSLQIPQYADEAADLARRLPELGGSVPLPKQVPSAIADQMPFGMAPVGAGLDESAKIADDVAQQADEFAGNIRLSKYPEDIQPELARWADENPDVVAQARRGTISNEETLASARQLVDETGGNFDRIVKEWKPGDAWNAEEITALRGVLNEKTQTVVTAARAVQAEASEANQIALVNALREQSRIQEAVSGVTAEAGRALQALRMDAAFLASNPDSAIARSLVQQAGYDPAKMGDVAKMLVKAADNPVQLNSIVRAIKKPGMWDYLTEIWINSLLAGPMTHARNFISNMATAAISPVERGFAAAVDLPFSKIQGRQVERFFREVPADAFGAMSGINDGLKAGLYTITHGGVRPGDASKIEFQHAWGGVTGNVIRIPSTMLEASDALWSSINYRAALSAEALRTARKEGLSGSALVDRVAELTTNPTDALIKSAKAQADYRVFRAPAGEWTKAIMNAREKIPPLRFIIPFLRTPANLMKFGIERSPLGLLDPSLWRNVKAGDAAASDQIGRALMGSAIAAGIALYAGEDKITGPVPSTSGARDLFYRMGKQPFSIKIGDQWVSYQQLEPLNQTFSQVSAIVNAIKDGEGGIDTKAMKALTSIGTNLVSQTYMSGLSDALNAIMDPERYGGNWISRTASGFVPFSSALRTATRATDTTLRQPEGIVETIKASLPGLSESVPPRLDAFGNEVQRSSPFYSPVGVSKEDVDAVDAELDRLGATVGFVGDSIGSRKLSREEQRDYQELAGNLTYLTLQELLSIPEWASLTDLQKQEAIDDAVTGSRKLARDYLKENNYRLEPSGVGVK